MKIMIILGGGGHTAQLLKLIERFGNNYDYEYVIDEDDRISKNKISYPGTVFTAKKTRGIKEFILISIVRNLIAIIPALTLLKKSKSTTIISCGPNFAMPIILVGKILGKKIIFIESWSRIYKKSLSGRFAYFIADKFFVQWPEMKKLYPRAIYAGRFA